MDERADIYYCLYGGESLGLRYFNVYGRRQDSQREYASVIPIFCKRFKNHIPPVINGDGSITRDFTYIDDFIQANDLSLNAGKENVNRSYNVA